MVFLVKRSRFPLSNLSRVSDDEVVKVGKQFSHNQFSDRVLSTRISAWPSEIFCLRILLKKFIGY